MLINCEVCKGKKTMIGLGNLIKDCYACKGIGWIEVPAQVEKVDTTKRRQRIKSEPSACKTS